MGRVTGNANLGDKGPRAWDLLSKHLSGVQAGLEAWETTKILGTSPCRPVYSLYQWGLSVVSNFQVLFFPIPKRSIYSLLKGILL